MRRSNGARLTQEEKIWGWLGVLKYSVDKMLQMNTLNAMAADLAYGFIESFLITRVRIIIS